jgi:autotransporter passenger strand-loop-strand repeat protein
MTTYSVTSGVTSSGITLGNGGTEYVYSGGRTVSTTVGYGGAEIVYSGGTGSVTTVSGGTEFVSSGSTAVGTTVEYFSTEVVDGGTAVSTTVSNGGTEIVYSSGTAGFNWVALEDVGISYNFTANATPGLVISAGSHADTITVGRSSQTVSETIGNLLVRVTAANAGVAIRGSTGSNELEITTGGTVTLNRGLNNITVQLDAASTRVLPRNRTVVIDGSTGNDVFVATSEVLRAGQQMDGGGGVNALVLQGGRAFGADEHSGGRCDRRAIGCNADHLPAGRAEQPDAEPGVCLGLSPIVSGGSARPQQ